ncbi:MAG: tail fiber domain-containing protein [Proteiniphilum sp.]|nr:tail fiber domain-containing protein [Proteiniphilum sp.]
MKTQLTTKISLVTVLLVLSSFFFTVSAQIKYSADNKLTIGNTQPYSFYHQTVFGNGMYFKCKTSNFFQIDVTPAATRLASHYDQVVFYNTATSRFNSIQVQNVYNQSDARAKTNIRSSIYGLDIIKQLRPVTYQYINVDQASRNQVEIGLIAQEVEKILPNIVYTDDEGKKLINYIALIPVLIESVKTLQAEVDALKAGK